MILVRKKLMFILVVVLIVVGINLMSYWCMLVSVRKMKISFLKKIVVRVVWYDMMLFLFILMICFCVNIYDLIKEDLMLI